MIPDCAHCGAPVNGYGTVEGQTVCHPDEGLDCYRLVTVYKHPMPCDHPVCCEVGEALKLAKTVVLAEHKVARR